MEEAKKKQKEGGARSASASKASTPVPAGREGAQSDGRGDVDKEGETEGEKAGGGEEGRLVPQLRIGKDGNIIIDEER